MFELSGKIAVITGGSRGIGRATAVALAKQGAHVVLTYVRGEDAARAAAEEIRAASGQADILQFDVADYAACEAALADVAKRLGRIDVLVASAGISIDALMLRLKEEDLDLTLAVNL